MHEMVTSLKPLHMKYLLLSLLFTPHILFAQMSKEKAMNKMRLDTSSIVTSQERILLYPRDLFYSVDDPNSVD